MGLIDHVLNNIDTALPGDIVVEDVSKLSADDLAAIKSVAFRVVLITDEFGRLVVADRKIEKIDAVSVSKDLETACLRVHFGNGNWQYAYVSPSCVEYEDVFDRATRIYLTEAERTELLVAAKTAVLAATAYRRSE